MAARIGFDVSPLTHPLPRGVRRAVAGAVAALEARERLDVVRLAPPPSSPGTPAGGLSRWRKKELPRLARAQGCAGVHSFLSSFPLRAPGRRVQTLHELPWRHGVRENADLAHRAWAALGPLVCDRVVVPSEHVAHDARARRLPGAGRIRVAPWGVGPPFAPEEPPGVVDELVLEHYRLGSVPFALALGAVRAKKGLASTLHGLAELVSGGGGPLQLVVTGPDTPDLRRDLGLASKLGLSRWVTTLEQIEEVHLPSLLRLAACVPVLSRSEGFGFPALEAAASGTPVLVPPSSAQAELVESAGIVVDPSDPSAVAKGLERALAERSALRGALLARAARYSWDACAERLEAVWEELV